MSLIPKILKRKKDPIYILVLSGKGGTGKSTIAIATAFSLREMGKRVALVDVDITTPNIPKMLGLDHIKLDYGFLEGEEKLYPIKLTDYGFLESEEKLYPVKPTDPILKNMEVMSVGFTVDRAQEIMWEGMTISEIVQEMITGVHWSEYDHMVIDMPPGTSTEIIKIMKELPQSKAIVVVLPQPHAKMDAGRVLSMLTKRNMKILGVVENMTTLYGSGEGVELAEQYGVPYLGGLEFHPEVPQALRQGENILNTFNDFKYMFKKIVTEL